jgi:hypothetical protein
MQRRLLHQNGDVLVDKLVAADFKQPLPRSPQLGPTRGLGATPAPPLTGIGTLGPSSRRFAIGGFTRDSSLGGKSGNSGSKKADTLAFADPVGGIRGYSGSGHSGSGHSGTSYGGGKFSSGYSGGSGGRYTDGGLLFAHPFFRSRFIFFVIVLY